MDKAQRVVWDFSATRPGEYSITVGVDDGSKVSGKTLTKTFHLKECPVCDLPCICPTIAVSGGGKVKAGDTMNFAAHVTGGTLETVEYKWTLSDGEITEGQGTDKIKVKTNDKMIGKTVVATVEINGSGLCHSCERTASESGLVVSKKPKN